MQPIIQEDKTGCGFACAATLAGVSYQHVKTVVGQLGIDSLTADQSYDISENDPGLTSQLGTFSIPCFTENTFSRHSHKKSGLRA